MSGGGKTAQEKVAAYGFDFTKVSQWVSTGFGKVMDQLTLDADTDNTNRNLSYLMSTHARIPEIDARRHPGLKDAFQRDIAAYAAKWNALAERLDAEPDGLSSVNIAAYEALTEECGALTAKVDDAVGKAEARLAEAARVEEERKAEEARKAEAARVAEALRVEEERKAEEARKAEAARVAEALRVEEERKAEEARKAEAARVAEALRVEEERKAEEARKAEAARMAEALRVEEERKAEEARKAEAARVAEALRKEEERKAEEARKAEEEAAESAAGEKEATPPVIVPKDQPTPTLNPAQRRAKKQDATPVASPVRTPVTSKKKFRGTKLNIDIGLSLRDLTPLLSSCRQPTSNELIPDTTSDVPGDTISIYKYDNDSEIHVHRRANGRGVKAHIKLQSHERVIGTANSNNVPVRTLGQYGIAPNRH